MAIHILNCGTMRPFFLRVGNGVTCLLAETNQGLALVDTGFGIDDFRNPKWPMRVFTAVVGSPRDLGETAYAQVTRLGYQPRDVGHIIMTHLHIDHAGGLPDFPDAQVHLFQPEYDCVKAGQGNFEYYPAHWAHNPNWKPHQLQGDQWYDFDAIRLAGFTPEIWLVPLVGHTPGLCGVAIRNGPGWVWHVSDAAPYNLAFDEVPAWISRRILGPHGPRIRGFMKAHPEVQVVGAHMALEFYKDL